MALSLFLKTGQGADGVIATVSICANGGVFSVDEAVLTILQIFLKTRGPMKMGPLVFKNVNGFVVIVYQASPNRLRFRIGCQFW